MKGMVVDIDKEEVLVVEVYLQSRRFEAKIQIPLNASTAAKKKFVDQWFSLIIAGLEMK